MAKLKTLFSFLFLLFTIYSMAQTDSLEKTDSLRPVLRRNVYHHLDSAAILRKELREKQRDSIIWSYLRPDPHRPNLFAERMLKENVLKTEDFLLLIHSRPEIREDTYRKGTPINKMPSWVLWSLFLIIFSFGLLKIVFSKETLTIIKAFYDNRILNQLNKEESIFNSWFFLFFYLIFSLLIGLFLYLFIEKYKIDIFNKKGFVLFISVSGIFAVFFGLKIVVLRIIGFIFLCNKVVKEYITVIYVSFFNISLFFIVLTAILLFTLYQNQNWMFYLGIILVSLVFILQFARILIQILSNHKLSKFYLIIYLCALEICPLVVIIKALDI